MRMCCFPTGTLMKYSCLNSLGCILKFPSTHHLSAWVSCSNWNLLPKQIIWFPVMLWLLNRRKFLWPASFSSKVCLMWASMTRFRRLSGSDDVFFNLAFLIVCLQSSVSGRRAWALGGTVVVTSSNICFQMWRLDVSFQQLLLLSGLSSDQDCDHDRRLILGQCCQRLSWAFPYSQSCAWHSANTFECWRAGACCTWIHLMSLSAHLWY